MNLLSFLRRNNPKKLSQEQVEVAWEAWAQHVTADDIRNLFLDSLTKIKEFPMMPQAVDPIELARFDDLVAGFDLDSDGQIELNSLLKHLTLSHATQTDLIRSTASNLEILITSHACFPFSSPTPLTRDAFCRAVLLLTSRCEKPFRFATWVSGKHGYDYVRTRYPRDRLMFIYSALARPPTGYSTSNDILDVVCRVRYPWFICSKNLDRLRPITDFIPLAERLEPSSLKDPSLLDPLPVSLLEPLHDIAKAFPPRHKEPAADLGFGGADTLTMNEFLLWARKVRLLEALDQLFCVFIPEAKCQCPKHRAMEEKIAADTPKEAPLHQPMESRVEIAGKVQKEAVK